MGVITSQELQAPRTQVFHAQLIAEVPRQRMFAQLTALSPSIVVRRNIELCDRIDCKNSGLGSTHRDWCRKFLAKPGFFTVIDSYPIELLFPIRQGRSPQQVGKKGKDKGRSLCRHQAVLAAKFPRAGRGVGLGYHECPRSALPSRD